MNEQHEQSQRQADPGKKRGQAAGRDLIAEDASGDGRGQDEPKGRQHHGIDRKDDHSQSHVDP